jgi:hypothetical protein
LPLDHQGFVNITPSGLNYTGPDILTQERFQLNINQNLKIKLNAVEAA